MQSETVRVELGERGYDIVIGYDIIAGLPSRMVELRLAEDVFVVTSPTVRECCGEPVAAALDAKGVRWAVCEFQDDEENKSLTTYERVLSLRFTGQLASDADGLTLTATGPAGSAPITFRRMSDTEVPDSPDEPVIVAREPEHRAYRGDAPDPTDDGWPTAAPADVGLDTTIIAIAAAGRTRLR